MATSGHEQQPLLSLTSYGVLPCPCSSCTLRCQQTLGLRLVGCESTNKLHAQT